MGGSGGGGNYRLNPSEINRLREEARARLDQSRLDTDVNGYLQGKLVDINDRDHESVNERLTGIQDALGDVTSDVDRVLFGGSVAKHTYVDGLSDIDALVVLDPASTGDQTPEEVRNNFRELLLRRLNRANVEDIAVGALAVTVHYRDGMEIQILPAAQQGDSVAISAPTGTEWVRIDPKEFASQLTRLNQQKGQSVIPAIKLAKAIIAQEIPESARPSGYHVESLALASFRDYEGPRTPKAMLQRFFETSSAAVMNPISDVTGQSQYVDQSLGEPGSAERRALARRLGLIAKKMQQSDSIGDWHVLLGE